MHNLNMYASRCRSDKSVSLNTHLLAMRFWSSYYSTPNVMFHKILLFRESGFNIHTAVFAWIMVPTLVMSMQINYDKLKHFPRSSLPVSSANNVENAAEMQCLHKAGPGFCCGQLGCAEGHSPSGMKTKSIYLYILSEILNTVSHLLLPTSQQQPPPLTVIHQGGQFSLQFIHHRTNGFVPQKADYFCKSDLPGKEI